MIKKLYSLATLALFILTLSHPAAGQEQAQGNQEGPVLTWDQERIDYGTVNVDDLPETKHDIGFTNTGTQPLVLSNVRACCGTRVTAWPRDPVMPGEKGTISVEFRLSPRPQNISRTVTVTSNDAAAPTKIFRIVGRVVEKE